MAGSDSAFFEPGQAEDNEVSRRIQPDGSLIRTLLSGRLEIYHADGTVAVRNPLPSELDAGAQLDPTSSAGDWLAHVRATYQGMMRQKAEDISTAAIMSGLPGHWIVRKLDGSRTARVSGEVLNMLWNPPKPSALNEDGTEKDADEYAEELELADKSLREVLLEAHSLRLVDDEDNFEYDVPHKMPVF